MTEPKWAQVFIARWRRPKDFNSKAWEFVFAGDLGEWDADTMIDVMKFMQSQGQDWGKFPTAGTLTMAYRVCARDKFKSIYDSLPRQKTKKDIIEEYRGKITRYVEHVLADGGELDEEHYGAIWDMVVDAEDSAASTDSDYTEIVDRLESWAKRTPSIQFDRKKTLIHRKAKEWRERQSNGGPLCGVLGRAMV